MNATEFDGAERHALLAAVGAFLNGEVAPALPDKALAFRVRVAANLLRIAVAEEVAGPPADDASCLEALRHKLGVVNPRFDLAEDID